MGKSCTFVLMLVTAGAALAGDGFRISGEDLAWSIETPYLTVNLAKNPGTGRSGQVNTIFYKEAGVLLTRDRPSSTLHLSPNAAVGAPAVPSGDRIRVACIGVRGGGRRHHRAFLAGRLPAGREHRSPPSGCCAPSAGVRHRRAGQLKGAAGRHARPQPGSLDMCAACGCADCSGRLRAGSFLSGRWHRGVPDWESVPGFRPRSISWV